MLPPSSRSEDVLAGDSLCTKEGEPCPPNHELFLNLTIVPSRPAPTSELQLLKPGIEAICELLVAETSSLEGAIHDSDELHEWLAKCLEAYLNNFHLRWPLFNAPAFDLLTAPLHLAASVCVIGVWLRNNTEWSERVCALRVHEILIQRLLHDLVGPL